MTRPKRFSLGKKWYRKDIGKREKLNLNKKKPNQDKKIKSRNKYLNQLKRSLI